MSVAAYDRAVTTLERQLALVHPGEPEFLLDYRRGLTVALVELGVLRVEDQREWEARFGSAARPFGTPDPELRARAVELLERELTRVRTGDPLGPREQFTTRLQALLESGIVGWDEKPGFVEKLDAVAPEPARPRPGSTFRLAQLRGVVLGPDRRVDGLRVTSAELYDDCTIVRWHLAIEEIEDWRGRLAISDYIDDLTRAHAPAALGDDLKTDYALQPQTGLTMPDTSHLDQQPAVLSGGSVFTPAVPHRATRLSVYLPTGQVQLDLDSPTNT